MPCWMRKQNHSIHFLEFIWHDAVNNNFRSFYLSASQATPNSKSLNRVWHDPGNVNSDVPRAVDFSGSFLSRTLVFASAPIHPAAPQTTPSLPPGKACAQRRTLLAVAIDYCWKRLHHTRKLLAMWDGLRLHRAKTGKNLHGLSACGLKPDWTRLRLRKK